MILYMKLALPYRGSITVRTNWFMVSKEEKTYRIGYKTENGYQFQYNVETFEVLFNG